MSRQFDFIMLEFETYQKDGCRRHKSRPGRACSRRQRAHRCTGQRGESLKIILVSNDLISILIIREIQNLRQEQRGPEISFSEEALLQVQWRADSLPQEHLAWAAQTQPAPWVVLQQVEATILTVFGGKLS